MNTTICFKSNNLWSNCEKHHSIKFLFDCFIHRSLFARQTRSYLTKIYGAFLYFKNRCCCSQQRNKQQRKIKQLKRSTLALFASSIRQHKRLKMSCKNHNLINTLGLNNHLNSFKLNSSDFKIS